MLRREKRGKVGFQHRCGPNVSDGFKKSIKQLESDYVKKKKKHIYRIWTFRDVRWVFFHFAANTKMSLQVSLNEFYT